jgi:hypothetical protein
MSFPANCSKMALAFIVGVVCAVGPSAAAPQRPTDDAIVLYVVPPGSADERSELRNAEAALSRDPQNLRLATKAARLAIEHGRAFADPRYYGRAEAALKPWWGEQEPPVEVRVLRAVIRQALHDFAGALKDLDAVISLSPLNTQARFSRAFVRMVIGRFDGAAEDCRALAELNAELPGVICTARVDALSGAALQGYERLQSALAKRGSDDPMREFAASVLADIAIALGRNEEAARLLAGLSGDGVVDVRVLAAAADLLLGTGRPAEALKLLAEKGDQDPLLLRRTIAAARVGDSRAIQWAAIMNERFAAAAAAGFRLHLREEARFRMEVERNPTAALPLALQNWEVQREPADARILLECALAAGDPAAATPVVEFVHDTGLADSRLTPLLDRLGKQS